MVLDSVEFESDTKKSNIFMHPLHRKVQYDYHSTMSHVPLTIYIKLFDYLNKHNIPCKHDIDEPIFYC